MSPSSVLLLDDHRVFTDLLRLTLDMQDDLRCVAVAHTVADALTTAEQTPFDVAVVDVQLPDGDGVTAVRGLLARRPDARIVVLTAHPRPDLAAQALAAGAAAFLAKDGSLTEILSAVRSADPADPTVCAAAGSAAADRLRLTPREWDVLRQLGRGRDARRAAAELAISLHTTRDHIKSLLSKLGVQTQLDAVVTAGRLGLIEIGASGAPTPPVPGPGH